MKEEFKIIANSIQREKSILDVGCGDGELMKFIYENISKKIKSFAHGEFNKSDYTNEKNIEECQIK